MELARYYMLHGSPTAALAQLDVYAAADGEWDIALRQLQFDAASAAGDLARADVAGRLMIEAGLTEPTFLIRMSEIATELRHFDDAERFLSQARQANPDNELYETLLRVLEKKRKRARVEELEQQTNSGGGAPDIFEELGDLHQDLGEFGKAMTSYQRATYGAPDRRVARAKLALVFARRGLHQEAEETLQETELSFDLPAGELAILKDLFYNCAELMDRDEESSRALATFRRVLRVEAGYRDVVSNVERLQRAERKRPSAS
jgi:tetratricopeptide (TPR) repeat protein